MTLQMSWTVKDEKLERRLAHAIEDERPLCFRYTKIGETDWNNRSVSPWEIQDTGTGKVLLSYDHEREAVRSFHLDGISAVTTNPWYAYMPQAAARRMA